MFVGDGHFLGPAVVTEGGDIHYELDLTRAPADVPAIRAAEEAWQRDYDATLDRIFGPERRSRTVTSGH
jgi:hypothetical protein